MSKKEHEFTIKYKFDSDFNHKYINGTMLSINPESDILLTFYFERLPLPYEQKVKKDANKSFEVTDIKPKDVHSTRIRFIDTGLVMNLEAAKELRELLDAAITDIENEKEEEE